MKSMSDIASSGRVLQPDGRSFGGTSASILSTHSGTNFNSLRIVPLINPQSTSSAIIISSMVLYVPTETSIEIFGYSLPNSAMIFGSQQTATLEKAPTRTLPMRTPFISAAICFSISSLFTTSRSVCSIRSPSCVSETPVLLRRSS